MILPLKSSILCFLLILSSCSAINSSKEEGISLQKLSEDPLSPEETKVLMEKAGKNWLYGNGLGESVLTIGTVVIFPPYAALVVGNSILSLSGYDPVNISDAMEEEDQNSWKNFYNTITSGPGRLAAVISGEEYRSKEAIKEDYEKFFEETRGSKQ